MPITAADTVSPKLLGTHSKIHNAAAAAAGSTPPWPNHRLIRVIRFSFTRRAVQKRLSRS